MFLLVACCHALGAEALDLPLLGRLPELGREWVLQKQGWSPEKQETRKKGAYDHAWATFTNSKTGDVISFAAERYAMMDQKVGSEAMHQATISMFPGGPPRFMLDGPAGWRVVSEIRCHVITLGTGIDKAVRKNVQAEALEYSHVYERDVAGVPNRLAHGYVLAFGDTVIFVQHTSARVITSDDARDTAISVLRNHPSSGLKP